MVLRVAGADVTCGNPGRVPPSSSRSHQPCQAWRLLSSGTCTCACTRGLPTALSFCKTLRSLYCFSLCLSFSEIPRFKHEPDGKTFKVNGMLLASLRSIDYIQPDFGVSGSGLSMPDLDEFKWERFEWSREVAKKCRGKVCHKQYKLDTA